MTAIVLPLASRLHLQAKDRDAFLLFGAIAAAAVIALGIYLIAPRVRVVCYGAGSVTDCARAADAALAATGTGHSVEAVAVSIGCFPGAFCMPPRDGGPIRLGATVGIRFADGTPAVLRDVADLPRYSLRVSEVLYGPDQFIDMILPTRGTSETWVRQPAGS
jgi:hypothetical protein